MAALGGLPVLVQRTVLKLLNQFRILLDWTALCSQPSTALDLDTRGWGLGSGVSPLCLSVCLHSGCPPEESRVPVCVSPRPRVCAPLCDAWSPAYPISGCWWAVLMPQSLPHTPPIHEFPFAHSLFDRLRFHPDQCSFSVPTQLIQSRSAPLWVSCIYRVDFEPLLNFEVTVLYPSQINQYNYALNLTLTVMSSMINCVFTCNDCV